MKYLIQENIFRERNYQVIIDSLERMGIEYDICQILPFTDTVLNLDNEQYYSENKNIFCFGSVKFAHIAKNQGWYPGSMYNENHDFSVYASKYKGNLLNEDYRKIKFGDKLPEGTPTLFFARPCKDNKIFTGGVFMEHSWYELVEHSIKNGSSLTENISQENVIICGLKDIAYEARCWVVNKQVITISEYRRGNRTRYKNLDDNLILKEQVKRLVEIWQPSDCFVIDICETVNEPGVIKIVEINCINASGFYEGNMPKLINSLNEFYDKNSRQ